MPCGLIAKSPNRWMRSRTGHPISASTVITRRVYPRPAERPERAQASAFEDDRHGSAEDDTTDDVGRIVHAEIRPRRADGEAERVEPEPRRAAGAELAAGGRGEREEDRRVAARPRGRARLADPEPGRLGVRGVRARPEEDLLEPLTGEPRRAGRGESPDGRRATAREGEDRARADRCPDRAEL